jgi:hypothetical protein
MPGGTGMRRRGRRTTWVSSRLTHAMWRVPHTAPRREIAQCLGFFPRRASHMLPKAHKLGSNPAKIGGIADFPWQVASDYVSAATVLSGAMGATSYLDLDQQGLPTVER